MNRSHFFLPDPNCKFLIVFLNRFYLLTINTFLLYHLADNNAIKKLPAVK